MKIIWPFDILTRNCVRAFTHCSRSMFYESKTNFSLVPLMLLCDTYTELGTAIKRMNNIERQDKTRRTKAKEKREVQNIAPTILLLHT